MKPHLLFCTNRPPLPTFDGTRERILGELQTISQYYLIDLWIIGNEKISEENKEKLIKICGGEVRVIHLSKLNCFIKSFFGLFSSQPLQVSYFYKKSFGRDIIKNIEKYKAIYFHTIRFGKYAELIKDKFPQKNNIILFNFNDAISLNYKEASVKAKGIWKLIYKIEEVRIKNYELSLIKNFFHFCIVTDRDRQYLLDNWEKKYKNNCDKKIFVIRHQINDDIFKYQYNPTVKNLIFIGNLLYPPNSQGLKMFCQKVWPLIIKKEPKTELTVIGRGADLFLKKCKNVKTLGFVDNPYPILASHYVFLNPVNFGAGVSTKTLVAMALGIPVVSTNIGAKGIEQIYDKKNIILIDYNNPEKCCSTIINALNNKNQLKIIGENGKQLAKNLYKGSINSLELIKFINSSVSND